MIYIYSSKIFCDQVSDFLNCLETILTDNPNRIYMYLNLDDIKKEDKTLIRGKISKANNLIMRPNRPVNKLGWLSELKFLQRTIKDEACCFILNHDHAFVDSTARMKFEKNAADFNQRYPKSFFYYSHAAELASYLLFPPIGLYFKKSDHFYVYTGKADWINGYFSTRLSTILSFMELIEDPPIYLPRPDWPDARYKPANYTIGFCLDEYCYHLDGYDHFITPSPIDYRNGMCGDLNLIKLQLLHCDAAIRKFLWLPISTRERIIRWLGKRLLHQYDYNCSSAQLNILILDILTENYVVQSLTFKRIIYSWAPLLFKSLFQRGC